jgi:hypothetical protein
MARLLSLQRSGRAVVDLAYDELGGGAAVGLGTHRGLLFQVLFDAIAAEPPLPAGIDAVRARWRWRLRRDRQRGQLPGRAADQPGRHPRRPLAPAPARTFAS